MSATNSETFRWNPAGEEGPSGTHLTSDEYWNAGWRTFVTTTGTMQDAPAASRF